MSPSDFVARLVGLVVAAAGAALAWGGLFVPLAALDGARGADLLARGAVANVGAVAALVGVGLVLAGLAVLVGRGRSVAVSVGGLVLAALVLFLVLAIDPGVGAAGPVEADAAPGAFGAPLVGLLAVGVLLAGEWIGGRSAG